MIRRLRLTWPDPEPFRRREGRPIRWLAVSDDEDPALRYEINRRELGPLDSIVGAGDLEPDYLGFLADAFAVPLLYVRGNHDRGGHWGASASVSSPHALRSGGVHTIDGIPVMALEWPGLRHGDRRRHDDTARIDILQIAAREPGRRLFGGRSSVVVLSHAPPRGVGDRAADPYHVGFGAYRWLLDRVRPPLWLHGHVPPASVEGWRIEHDGTTVVNVTGAVLVELVPPEDAPGEVAPG
jgi:hypothetical protein